MNKYNDILELTILSTLLINPELMEKVKLEDKHFKKTKRMWLFMKEFYKRYKTFDSTLMCHICKDRWQMCEYITMLLDYEGLKCNFDLYQEELIEEYNQTECEKEIKEKVYKLATEMYVGNISITDFKNQCEKIYKKSER